MMWKLTVKANWMRASIRASNGSIESSHQALRVSYHLGMSAGRGNGCDHIDRRPARGGTRAGRGPRVDHRMKSLATSAKPTSSSSSWNSAAASPSVLP